MPSFDVTASQGAARVEPSARIFRILESLGAGLPPSTGFDVDLCGERVRIGAGPVQFSVAVRNRNGISALSSLDEN